VHAALDHVTFDHAVGEARRRVGAFVVGDVERPVDVVDRKVLSPTANALTEPGVTSDFEQTRTTLSASGAMTGGPPYLDMPFSAYPLRRGSPTRACSRRGATTGGLDPPQDAPRRAREGRC